MWLMIISKFVLCYVAFYDCGCTIFRVLNCARYPSLDNLKSKISINMCQVEGDWIYLIFRST